MTEDADILVEFAMFSESVKVAFRNSDRNVRARSVDIPYDDFDYLVSAIKRAETAIVRHMEKMEMTERIGTAGTEDGTDGARQMRRKPDPGVPPARRPTPDDAAPDLEEFFKSEDE